MPKVKSSESKSKGNDDSGLNFEAQLWAAAEQAVPAPHCGMTEYNGARPEGLFLKYISDAFEEKREQLLFGFNESAAKSKDVLGRVYEYFLGKFASAEGTLQSTNTSHDNQQVNRDFSLSASNGERVGVRCRIPYEFHHPLPDLSKHPRGAEVLSQIRDMTRKRPWPYSHFGRDLFWLLGPFAFCLQILNEWIESDDEPRFKGALALLSEIESDFIFSRPDYVESVLISAQKHGAERLKDAKSCFFFCATRHGESRTVGQPGPTTLSTKDRAAELAKKYSAGSMMAGFYESIVKQSEARLADEKLRDEELLEGE